MLRGTFLFSIRTIIEITYRTSDYFIQMTARRLFSYCSRRLSCFPPAGGSLLPAAAVRS
jgi:hypothetical protein